MTWMEHKEQLFMERTRLFGSQILQISWKVGGKILGIHLSAMLCFTSDVEGFPQRRIGHESGVWV